MALTTQDLKQIKTIVEEVVEEKLEDKLSEKIKFLPTTDVFLSKMDEVNRVSVHSDEISALQDIHPNNLHAIIH